MIPFILGAIVGGSVVYLIAQRIISDMSQWYNGRLDWWADRVSECQDVVEELRCNLKDDVDAADWWRNE